MFGIGIFRLILWGLPLFYITIKEEQLLKKDELNPEKESYATYCLLEKELDDKKKHQDAHNELEGIKIKTEEMKNQLEK